MRQDKMIEKKSKGKADQSPQDGSAVVIALFVLALVGAFAALAITRTATEAAAVGNEATEGRTFYAAQGSLETMTRNFNKVFELKLTPTDEDLAIVEDENRVPILPIDNGGEFTFKNELLKTSPSKAETLSGGSYAGLYALRDRWRLRTTATDRNTQTQVQLTRNILNNRIPIFQFGIFYDDDLELFRPPKFNFGGRVHSNRHFFLSPGTEGIYFDSRVTAVGHIITQSWRNGNSGDAANSETWIKNASGVFKKLQPTMGSVLNGTPNEFGPGKPFADADMPSSKLNSSFNSQITVFDGNLKANVDPLKLPLKVGGNVDLVEMIRRGKKSAAATGSGDIYTGTADNDILTSERFANKTGIRVSLADSKAKLPGCAAISTITPPSAGTAVATPCGIRLDGHFSGDGTNPVAVPGVLPINATIIANSPFWSRGYQPKAMKLTTADAGFGYVPTRINGERLHMGAGREVWIKVELVHTNDTTGAIETREITEDILSLGMTEEAPSYLTPTGYTGARAAANNGTPTTPSANLTATTAQTATTFPDSRSVLKIQRFAIPGLQIPQTTPVATAAYATYNVGGYNYVRRYTSANGPAGNLTSKLVLGCQTANPFATADRCATLNGNADPTISANGNNANDRERYGHLKLVGTEAVVAFPIEMFDSREGEYYDAVARYTAGKVTRNGVMSMIDIDVANLRRFLRGDFNGLFPTTTPFAGTAGHSLTASFNGTTDIPQKEGWVLYVSDRRGDADFDGEYDMEDIYSNSPGNTGGMENGEDVNHNGLLDAKYITATFGNNGCQFLAAWCEAARYQDEWEEDFAAVTDHKYYRRGVRLINGTTIPGIYDKVTSSNIRGFTVASENGVYVKGNFNATHVTSIPAAGNTPYNNYRPFDDAVHIPASIVADAITILSNSWQDSESYAYPYDKGTYRQATDTTIRFAMIAGDTISTYKGAVNQGTSVSAENLNGGVHNFKRFLEKWTGNNLNYSGSLINLYNSRNNNGPFKCCNTVYDPPTRNWVFDSTFLDPTRIPPGTPFFQYVQTTGFERTNN